MGKFYVANEGHVVNILPPVDIGGVAKTSDYFSLKNYTHASILITCGAITNAATITVEESDDASGTNTTAIAFEYFSETTSAGDTLGTRTSASASGFSTGTTNSVTFVIEIDSEDLSDGYPYLVVKATNAAANLISMVAVLSGARYPAEASITAIT